MYHVQHTSNAVYRITGRDLLPYCHLREMRGVECREKAQHMCCIIYRNTRDRYHVLRILASVYMQPCIILCVSLDPRQQLRITHGVGIAQYLGQTVHEVHIHAHPQHTSILYWRDVLVYRHNESIQHTGYAVLAVDGSGRIATGEQG